MAATLFRELRSQFLLLFFKLVELHFDQFLMSQRLAQSGEECPRVSPWALVRFQIISA